LLWPFEVVSLALGFAMAALFGRVVWLGIPAILIGANGLVLAFCNATGLWHWWSVLWAIEPLAVGLCLLLIAWQTRSTVVGAVGLAFCGFSGFAFVGMTALLSFDGWVLRMAGPAFIILAGLGLMALNVFPRRVQFS
jgi:hypothetical protein